MYYKIDTIITVLVFLFVFFVYINRYLTRRQPIITVLKNLSLFMILLLTFKALNLTFPKIKIIEYITSFFTFNLPAMLYIFVHTYILKKQPSNRTIFNIFALSVMTYLVVLTLNLLGELKATEIDAVKSVLACVYMLMMAVVIFLKRKTIPLYEIVIIFTAEVMPFILYIALKALGVENLLVTEGTAVAIILMCLFLGERLIEIDINTRALTRKNFDIQMEINYKEKGNDYTIIYILLSSIYLSEEQNQNKESYLKQFAKIAIENLGKKERLVYNGRNEFMILTRKIDKESVEKLIDSLRARIDKYNDDKEQPQKFEYSIGYKTAEDEGYNDVRIKSFIAAYENMKKVEVQEICEQ